MFRPPYNNAAAAIVIAPIVATICGHGGITVMNSSDIRVVSNVPFPDSADFQLRSSWWFKDRIDSDTNPA